MIIKCVSCKLTHFIFMSKHFKVMCLYYCKVFLAIYIGRKYNGIK